MIFPARLLSARSLRTVTTRCATGGGRGSAARGPAVTSRGWKRSKGGIKVTYSEKVEWLKRYRYAVNKVKYLWDVYWDLEKSPQNVTQAFRDTPHSSGVNNSVAEIVERLEDERQRCQCAEADKNAIRAEIEQALETMKSPFEREVLYRHYIGFQTFERIAEQKNKSVAWVKRLHTQGINDLEK